MGGFGSGRRKRRTRYGDKQRKPLVEEAFVLDSAGLDWEGLLKTTKGTLFQKRGKAPVTLMKYQVHRDEYYGDELVLQYNADLQWNICSLETRNLVRQEILIEETTPFFGGRRRWFSCPGCGRRVRILYIPKDGNMLRCRHCHGLTYRSVQTHDKRVDELVRNPERAEQIVRSCKGAPLLSINSRFFLAMKALARLT